MLEVRKEVIGPGVRHLLAVLVRELADAFVVNGLTLFPQFDNTINSRHIPVLARQGG
jgi:hypothetical protein